MDFSSFAISDFSRFVQKNLNLSHPLLPTITTLHQQGKTVCQLIKEKQAIYKNEIMAEIKKKFNLSDDDFTLVNNILTDYKKNILPQQSCTILFDDYFKTPEYKSLRDAITETALICKLQEPIEVVLDPTIDHPLLAAVTAKMYINQDTVTPMPCAITKVEYTLRIGKNFTSNVHDRKAILLHELSHIKKQHTCRQELLLQIINIKYGKDKHFITTMPSFIKLSNFCEFEADQYLAKKDFTIAQNMETYFYNLYTQQLLYVHSHFNGYMHPSTRSRYKSLQYIRQLLKLENHLKAQ